MNLRPYGLSTLESERGIGDEAGPMALAELLREWHRIKAHAHILPVGFLGPDPEIYNIRWFSDNMASFFFVIQRR